MGAERGRDAGGVEEGAAVAAAPSDVQLVVEEEEDEGDSECCICYVEEPHRRAQFTSCSHWVCTTCAERIMLWGGLCPLCRCLVVGLDVPERVEEGTELLRLCPRQERGWYVGVKMEDEPGGHVRVCWTHPADLARRYGIRAGDVILRVNGVAAKSHRVVKAIMDRVTEEEGESALLLEVRKGPRRRRGVGSLLACTARVSTAA